MVEPRLEERVQNITGIADAIIVIKKCGEIIRTQKQKIINIVATQGQLLKEFKACEIFFETLNQSKSTIYFNINLPKFLKKYPALKKSTQSSNYFKNNFELFKMVCKTNVKLFTRRKDDFVYNYCFLTFLSQQEFLLCLIVVRISYPLCEFLTCCENSLSFVIIFSLKPIPCSLRRMPRLRCP